MSTVAEIKAARLAEVGAELSPLELVALQPFAPAAEGEPRES
jgi:hypothetical protein